MSPPQDPPQEEAGTGPTVDQDHEAEAAESSARASSVPICLGPNGKRLPPPSSDDESGSDIEEEEEKEEEEGGEEEEEEEKAEDEEDEEEEKEEVANEEESAALDADEGEEDGVPVAHVMVNASVCNVDAGVAMGDGVVDAPPVRVLFIDTISFINDIIIFGNNMINFTNEIIKTGILLPAHIWAEIDFKMRNFPPIASVAKPLVELMTPSPWPSGLEFKPQLRLMMSSINGEHLEFNARRKQML